MEQGLCCPTLRSVHQRLSECDFALPDWRQACWGAHWARLDRVKQAYDPDGLFFVHHGIGSERWSADGFDRVG